MTKVGSRPATMLFATTLALGSNGCGPERYDDVWLVGHRGSPFAAPENSLAGFDLAYAQGADGLEFDVQLTADGRNVVMHDETLDRTTSCTGPVRDYTLDRVRVCTLANGEPVVPLDEMLVAVGARFEVLFLEIKVPEEQPPPPDETVAQVDDAVSAVLASGLGERAVLISYDSTALIRIAERQHDGIHGGWDQFSTDSVSNAERYDLPWVLMPIQSIEPWVGDVVVGLGRELAVYQVVTEAEFVRAIDGRARAIIADSLDTLASMLGRKPRDLPDR
jgi:glycerophosphoryl diester phosphodiesterase